LEFKANLAGWLRPRRDDGYPSRLLLTSSLAHLGHAHAAQLLEIGLKSQNSMIDLCYLAVFLGKLSGCARVPVAHTLFVHKRAYVGSFQEN
jgi:hypothetical protein